MFPDPSPKLGDSDNVLLFKIAQSVQAASVGGAGVSSFNTRTGDVALTSADVGAVGVSSFNTRTGNVALVTADISDVLGFVPVSSYPITVYAEGTPHVLTNTIEGVVFGATSPILTITQPGTYAIRARVVFSSDAATMLGDTLLTTRLRRTNNTPLDIPKAETRITLGNTLVSGNMVQQVISLPEVIYITSNSDDTIQLFSGLSIPTDLGNFFLLEADIVAIRLS